MRAICAEHEGCFEIVLTADTLAEASTLVRFGLNRTTEMRHATTWTTRNSADIGMSLVIGKRKNVVSEIKP